MKNYELFESVSDNYKYLIVNTDKTSLDSKLDSFNDDLKKKSFSGYILFNYLTFSFSRKRQFCSAYFDGNHIDIDSIRQLKTVDQNTADFVDHYFSMNPQLLKNSLFTI